MTITLNWIDFDVNRKLVSSVRSKQNDILLHLSWLLKKQIHILRGFTVSLIMAVMYSDVSENARTEIYTVALHNCPRTQSLKELFSIITTSCCENTSLVLMNASHSRSLVCGIREFTNSWKTTWGLSLIGCGVSNLRSIGKTMILISDAGRNDMLMIWARTRAMQGLQCFLLRRTQQ